MDLFNNHRSLYITAFLFFVGLSIVVAILPAINNQNNNAPLPNAELVGDDIVKGKLIFIANGCVACHSQQVRNVEMDKPWGTRPSIAADYASITRESWWMNTATLMGTERTGPDLTNIGTRLPSEAWHLLHLYNPRAVVSESIMPSYKWMFETKRKAAEGDHIVNVPEEFLDDASQVVVAREEALQLVAYLQSLKQTPLPDGRVTPEFLYKKENQQPSVGSISSKEQMQVTLDGAALYAANCQACHQSNGEGLKGAFPPLKGSKIVLDENPEVMIDIIMNGYNGREEFGEMPAIGTMNKLTSAEIAAIVNHEKTSWGNQGKPVSVEEVEKIISFLKSQPSE